MIQTLNPSKTDEIMSRYRPIAPKPDTTAAGGLVVPEKFRQSPYLRNIWSHLQARPTRTRKRAARAPSILRKHHNHMANLSYPIVTLPLLSPSPENPTDWTSIPASASVPVLEEKDLLLQLQAPNNNNNNGVVISPRPVKPVGSTVSVMGPISEDPGEAVVRTSEQIEEAMEEEALPVVVSDRSNKVRMANWAYKELVGQPECPWLDMTAMRSSSGKRIGGEVMINLPSGSEMGNGFSCWVRIEWEREGKKSGINTFCNVVKLVCESNKDCMFSWRFHTREVSPSGSKVV